MISVRDPDALISGGGISFLNYNLGELELKRRRRSLSYGYSSLKGKRNSMEDYYHTAISQLPGGHLLAFFAVFDGHGGCSTAQFLKNHLFNNLSNHPDLVTDPKSAIGEVFRSTDADYLNQEQQNSGSTASTVLLLGDKLLVANVGDSRVVASKHASAVPLSVDHTPDRSDERQRIEDAGGFVLWEGTWRVAGILAVSRAFGDKHLKKYVVSDPEIQEEEIDGIDFIIIATDGLWNVISNTDAVGIVKDISDSEAASRKLVQAAYARGSSDNITCVVVRFDISP